MSLPLEGTRPPHVLTEADRKRYFRTLYPADLVATLIGHTRCAAAAGPPRLGDLKARSMVTIDRDLSSAATLANYLYAAEGTYSLHVTDAVTAPILGGTECLGVLTTCEVGIDIDLNDYGERRALFCACAATKKTCDACWLLAEMAVAVCEAIVTGACALGPMLCVASGGKGLHMWWGSPQARRLSPPKRAALVALLTAGPPKMDDSQVARAAHEAGLGALMDVWVKRGIVSRALLADINSTLAQNLAQDAGAGFAWPRDELVAHLLPGARSKKRWAVYVAHVGSARAREVVRLIGWPRPDTSVTVGRGHLLKTPFSIHHTTGRVALPLPSVRYCLPSQLPTVCALVDGDDKEARRRFEDGRAALQAWLVACQYGPQYEFYNI
jgi:DNA primase catalytic subunit